VSPNANPAEAQSTARFVERWWFAVAARPHSLDGVDTLPGDDRSSQSATQRAVSSQPAIATQGAVTSTSSARDRRVSTQRTGRAADSAPSAAAGVVSASQSAAATTLTHAAPVPAATAFIAQWKPAITHAWIN